MMFKVPSLRNIEKTGPYFHDGQTADLSTAVKMMAEYQLGKQLSDAGHRLHYHLPQEHYCRACR